MQFYRQEAYTDRREKALSSSSYHCLAPLNVPMDHSFDSLVSKFFDQLTLSDLSFQQNPAVHLFSGAISRVCHRQKLSPNQASGPPSTALWSVSLFLLSLFQATSQHDDLTPLLFPAPQPLVVSTSFPCSYLFPDFEHVFQPPGHPSLSPGCLSAQAKHTANRSTVVQKGPEFGVRSPGVQILVWPFISFRAFFHKGKLFSLFESQFTSLQIGEANFF